MVEPDAAAVSLLCEKRGGIAYVTLNRPDKHNALDPELVCRLADAWADIATDPEVRVVLLTGAGEKAFSAGADLARLLPLITRARPPTDDWDHRYLREKTLLEAALLRGTTFFKPIVAAVRGYALAGGTELLLATDVRIAAEGATFGLTEVRRGIIPGGGSLTRLARQVPWCEATELILSGEPISAEHAARIGLINRVVPAERLQDEAEQVARSIAKGAPLALAKAKEAMVRTNGLPLAESFAIESECARAVLRSEDAKEGSRAFVERREPRFVGG